jgi:hypothetical protein
VRIAGSGARKTARCSQSLRGKGDVAPRCIAAGTSGPRWPIPTAAANLAPYLLDHFSRSSQFAEDSKETRPTSPKLPRRIRNGAGRSSDASIVLPTDDLESVKHPQLVSKIAEAFVYYEPSSSNRAGARRMNRRLMHAADHREREAESHEDH